MLLDAEHIRRELARGRLSQVRFARRVGIAPETLSKGLRGRSVSEDTARRIAKALKRVRTVSPDELLEKTG